MKLSELKVNDKIVDEVMPVPPDGQEPVDPSDPAAQRKMMARKAANTQERRKETQDAIKLKQDEIRRNQEELQNLRQQLASLR